MNEPLDAPMPSVPSVSTPALPGVVVFTGGEWIPLKRPNFIEAMAELAEEKPTDV